MGSPRQRLMGCSGQAVVVFHQGGAQHGSQPPNTTVRLLVEMVLLFEPQKPSFVSLRTRYPGTQPLLSFSWHAYSSIVPNINKLQHHLGSPRGVVTKTQLWAVFGSKKGSTSLHLTATILHPRGETAMGNFHHQKALVVQATLTIRLRSGATTGAVNAGSLSVPAITAVAPGHTTLIVPRACRSPKSPSSLHCT